MIASAQIKAVNLLSKLAYCTACWMYPVTYDHSDNSGASPVVCHSCCCHEVSEKSLDLATLAWNKLKSVPQSGDIVRGLIHDLRYQYDGDYRGVIFRVEMLHGDRELFNTWLYGVSGIGLVSGCSDIYHYGSEDPIGFNLKDLNVIEIQFSEYLQQGIYGGAREAMCHIDKMVNDALFAIDPEFLPF